MDRKEILRAFFKAADFGLEIGPSYNPVAPKNQGYNVETTDYTSAANLREKYKDEAVDISLIEEVDYVTDGQRISSIIKNKHYDYILASHVIEHIPDIVGFFKDCEFLLKENGVLILAVPDKRYCFDVFKPLSSTGDILQAYLEQRTRHPLGKYFDDLAYNASCNDSIAWSQDTIGSIKLMHSVTEATKKVESIKESKEYHDVHGWRFTPDSFRLIINDLFQAGYISLKEKDFHDTLGCEFFITLSRSGTGCPVDREIFLETMYVENSELIKKHIAGDHSNNNISVVIPFYNGKRYIEETIKSVVNQTLPAHEIIVVDDGSSNDSALLLQELLTKYPIKYFRKENGGQSSARNYGVQVSSGDLIAFLDQDDVWYPNHLEELLAPYLRRHYRKIGWVNSNMDQIGHQGDLMCVNFLNALPGTHPKTSIFQCLTSDMYVLPSATLISKQAFNEVGGFDERLCGYEDDDLFLRIFEKGYANIFINKPLHQWRFHDTSCSHSNKFLISRMIYAKKLLEKYQNDLVIDVNCRNNLILRFAKCFIADYARGVAHKDKYLTILSCNHLRELFQYLDYQSIYKIKGLLFFARHRFLKAICRPFYKIYSFVFE